MNSMQLKSGIWTSAYRRILFICHKNYENGVHCSYQKDISVILVLIDYSFNESVFGNMRATNKLMLCLNGRMQ